MKLNLRVVIAAPDVVHAAFTFDQQLIQVYKTTLNANSSRSTRVRLSDGRAGNVFNAGTNELMRPEPRPKRQLSRARFNLVADGNIPSLFPSFGKARSG